MANYENGKIYKLTAPGTEKVYIGSTTKNLDTRLCEHRCQYNTWTEGKKRYSAFDVLSNDDYKIELIENYACNSRKELEAREGEIIRNTPNCVNRCIPGRTDRERRYDHYHRYEEKYRQQAKEIYYANREAILAKRKAAYLAKKAATISTLQS